MAREATSVVQRRLGIVDAARAGDDEQAVVVAVKHRGDLLAAADHRRGALLAERELVEECRRRQELDDPLDAAIPNRVPRALALHSRDHRGFSRSCITIVIRTWFLSFKRWRTGAGKASGGALLLGGPKSAGPDA